MSLLSNMLSRLVITDWGVEGVALWVLLGV